eukprot:140429-Heterocapsa_arctica.AAC.1
MSSKLNSTPHCLIAEFHAGLGPPNLRCKYLETYTVPSAAQNKLLCLSTIHICLTTSHREPTHAEVGETCRGRTGGAETYGQWRRCHGNTSPWSFGNTNGSRTT